MSLSKLMKKRGKENWTIRRVAEAVAEAVSEAVAEAVSEAVAEAVAEAVCERENETNRHCHHCYTVFLQVCVYN